MQIYELAKLSDFILFNLSEYNNLLKDDCGDKKEKRRKIIKIKSIVESELIKYHKEKNIANLLNDDEELDKFLSEIKEIIKSGSNNKEVS